MPTLRNPAARSEILQRLQRLTPSTNPKWGRFDASRMVCHLNDSLAVGLGEISSRSLNRKAFQHFPLKHLAMYVVPFPRGFPAPPEMLSTAPAGFEGDRQRLFDLIDRLAAAPECKGPEHPLFGALSTNEWNALQWKHIDHHLKQFGC
jgi:Protein of unknown function (DUF1569)